MASSRLLRRCAVISLLLALLLACAPQTVLLLNRALVLSLALSPAVLLSPAAAASSTIQQCLFLPALRHALGRSAALTKWGQWAATRPDLVPPSVCEALSVLHAHAPAHAAAISRAEVEAATGASIEDYFDAWEDEPLASGSIGQVHLARRTDSASSVMRDSFLPQVHLARLNGSAVAVKVRHPRVGAELEARLRAARAAAYAQPLHTFTAREQADFRLLELLARAVDSVPGLRWLDAQSTVKQFGWALQRQASLEEEARWLRLVGRNFEAWGDVLLPAPLSASPSVLIETLVPGALRRGHTPSCSFYSVIVLSCARRAHRRIHQLRRCDRLGPRPDPRAREAASNLCGPNS